MSDIQLNLSGSNHKRQPGGNSKHRRFVKKKHFLERKGLLNEKQNKYNHHKHGNGDKPWFMQTEKRQRPQAGAVFPKFVTSQREVSSDPSRSMQGRQNCASEQNEEPSVPSSSSSRGESSSSAVQKLTPGLGKPHKYVAIDCEMVGTGPKGHCSELARCSIVTYDGDVIYDNFIKPVNPVTDLRTRWSGIRWQDLRNAIPFKQAQRDILKILSEKVVVGHAIQNDLKVLHYSHPYNLIRDTSRIPILNQKAGLPMGSPVSLKRLTKLLFDKDIQVGKKGHSSVEDAKATMELYRLVEVEWERTLAS